MLETTIVSGEKQEMVPGEQKQEGEFKINEKRAQLGQKVSFSLPQAFCALLALVTLSLLLLQLLLH